MLNFLDLLSAGDPVMSSSSFCTVIYLFCLSITNFFKNGSVVFLEFFCMLLRGQSDWKNILVSPFFGEEPKAASKRGLLLCFNTSFCVEWTKIEDLMMYWFTQFFCRIWFLFSCGRTHLTAISVKKWWIWLFFLLDKHLSKESLIFYGCGETCTDMKKIGQYCQINLCS